MTHAGKPTKSRKAAKSKGTLREHDVRKLRESEGYVVYRGAASLGAADLIALKAGKRPELIQVKANVDGGPYANFRRSERIILRAEAAKAGAYATLAHWPHPKGSDLCWYDETVWP